MVYLKKFKTYESNSPEYEGVLDKYLETQIIQAQETISDLTDEQKEEIKDFYTQKMQEFVANSNTEKAMKYMNTLIQSANDRIKQEKNRAFK